MASIIFNNFLAFEALGSSSNCDLPRRVLPFDSANPPASLDGHLVISGPLGTTPPVHPPYITPGLYSPSSFDDWYYRIHMYPVTLALGNLVGNQQREVVLWNAFFNNVTLQDFVLANGIGITVTEPVITPYTMRPLEDLTYLFEISANGPPVVDATATWTIDGEDFVIPITGRRVVLMPFKPNWSGAVDETLESLTTVRPSYDNTFEQVVEIRGKGPRRILQYQVRLHRDAANVFDNLTFGWQGRVFATPLWQEETNLQGAVFLGANVLTVDTTVGRTFAAGTLAVLYGNYLNFEIVEVLSTTPTSITLTRGTEFAWPDRTEVIPAMVCNMDAMTSTRRASDTHVDAIIRFTSTADMFARFDGGTAPVTYRGEELYVGRTNWIQPLQISTNSLQTQFDGYGTGVYRVTRRAAFPVVQRGYAWTKKGKAENEELRKFFARRRGRFKNAWLSSGVTDFRLTSPALSSESSFKVHNTQYGVLLGMNPARRNVLIEMRDGTYIARQILDYQLDSLTGEGIVSVDSALGKNLSVQNVKRISFLGLYRMSSDSITFSWKSIEICSMEANFTLKQPT